MFRRNPAVSRGPTLVLVLLAVLALGAPAFANLVEGQASGALDRAVMVTTFLGHNHQSSIPSTILNNNASQDEMLAQATSIGSEVPILSSCPAAYDMAIPAMNTAALGEINNWHQFHGGLTSLIEGTIAAVATNRQERARSPDVVVLD